MKKCTLSLILICCVSIAKAQLTVNSSGNVGVGLNPDNTHRIKVKGVGNQNTIGTSTAIEAEECLTSSTCTAYGITGKATSDVGFRSGFCIGVHGIATGSNDGKNFGVYGTIAPYHNGAGIYGSASSFNGLHALSAKYAGFFDGNVYISGSSSLTGVMLNSLSSQNAYNFSLLSQRRDSGQTTSGLLSLIKPMTYNVASTSKDAENIDVSSLTNIDIQVMEKQHYGLDADLLEEVFPDLVYENEDGSKSINYVEMVPILVQAINELKAELTELRGSDEKTQTRASEGDAKHDEMGEKVTLLSLGENRPNPFSNTTAIPVSIPEDVQRAFIYVYDLTGKKVQQVDIPARGKQNITLDASALTDGMYLYSLIADGKVVQTRRMIVEK